MASLTFQNFIFFRPQTRFSSNVIVIFLKSLNVWKDIACRDSLHESFFKKNVSFPEPDTISPFCLLMYIYVFSFYSVTPLCPYYVYNDNLWTDITLLFYMTEHNYGDFCNQKQASTKNVNANLTGSLYGAT